MKSDKIERLHNSVVQHGKINDRIYLMNLADEDQGIIIAELNLLAKKYDYSKIFCKVKEVSLKPFINDGFIVESSIPKYYNGKDTCIIASKFLDKKRKELTNKQEIDEVIRVAKSKAGKDDMPSLGRNMSIRKLTKDDTKKMTEVYKVVFETYPFPIHDQSYLAKTMDQNVVYYGIFDIDKLLGISSSELNTAYKNAEMTDFAILPEYRGKNFALLLLSTMEKNMKNEGYKTLYTIARAVSFGMNSTFAKLGYTFNGTLINNTNISGNIESMNIWYKHLG